MKYFLILIQLVLLRKLRVRALQPTCRKHNTNTAARKKIGAWLEGCALIGTAVSSPAADPNLIRCWSHKPHPLCLSVSGACAKLPGLFINGEREINSSMELLQLHLTGKR